MSRNSKALKTKTTIFACLSLTAIAVALIVVRPGWIALLSAFALLLIALLGFSACPAGTGHVGDGAVTYVITAVLLISLALMIGWYHRLKTAEVIPPHSSSGTVD